MRARAKRWNSSPVTRRVIVIALATLLTATALSTAHAEVLAAKRPPSFPVHIAPRTGSAHTMFRLSFRAIRTLRHHEVYDIESLPLGHPETTPGTGDPCATDYLRFIHHARRGEALHVRMGFPNAKWCAGRYRATVFLETDLNGPSPRALAIGKTTFRVTP